MKDLHDRNITKLDSEEDMSRENTMSFLYNGVIKSCLDDDDNVCVCCLLAWRLHDVLFSGPREPFLLQEEPNDACNVCLAI